MGNEPSNVSMGEKYYVPPAQKDSLSRRSESRASQHIHASNQPANEALSKEVSKASNQAEVFTRQGVVQEQPNLAKHHVTPGLASSNKALARQQTKTDVAVSQWVKAKPRSNRQQPAPPPEKKVRPENKIYDVVPPLPEKEARTENKIYDAVPPLPPELDPCHESTQKLVDKHKRLEKAHESSDYATNTIVKGQQDKVQQKKKEYEKTKAEYSACCKKPDRRDPAMKAALILRRPLAKQNMKNAKNDLMQAKKFLSAALKENKQKLTKYEAEAKHYQKQAIETLKVYETQCKMVLSKVKSSGIPTTDALVFLAGMTDLMENLDKNLPPPHAKQLAPYKERALIQLNLLKQTLKAATEEQAAYGAFLDKVTSDQPAAIANTAPSRSAAAPGKNQTLSAANATEWDAFLKPFAASEKDEDLQVLKFKVEVEINTKQSQLDSLLSKEDSDSDLIGKLRKNISQLKLAYKDIPPSNERPISSNEKDKPQAKMKAAIDQQALTYEDLQARKFELKAKINTEQKQLHDLVSKEHSDSELIGMLRNNISLLKKAYDEIEAKLSKNFPDLKNK